MVTRGHDDKDLFGQPRHTRRGIEGEEYTMIKLRETDRAVLLDTGEGEMWFPKAVIAIDIMGPETIARGGRLETPVRVTIPDSIARQKGLIE